MQHRVKHQSQDPEKGGGTGGRRRARGGSQQLLESVDLELLLFRQANLLGGRVVRQRALSVCRIKRADQWKQLYDQMFTKERSACEIGVCGSEGTVPCWSRRLTSVKNWQMFLRWSPCSWITSPYSGCSITVPLQANFCRENKVPFYKEKQSIYTKDWRLVTLSRVAKQKQDGHAPSWRPWLASSCHSHRLCPGLWSASSFRCAAGFLCGCTPQSLMGAGHHP